MAVLSLEDAQARLPDLIAGLHPGEEILITRDEQLVAKLVGTAKPRKEPQLGTLKGTVLYMAPDFDAPLEDFKEYME
jgi:antitoxin (DNA-binding transcriptional repressor) of toxin-antitoxin stability system